LNTICEHDLDLADSFVILIDHLRSNDAQCSGAEPVAGLVRVSANNNETLGLPCVNTASRFPNNGRSG
jgi:hypothetical protein